MTHPDHDALPPDDEHADTEQLLLATRDEPPALLLSGFARRTADRALERRRRVFPWPWRWAVTAAGVAAGAALWLQATPQAARYPAGEAGAPGKAGAMHEETVDYEFALDALDDADLASFDRWLDQDPS